MSMDETHQPSKPESGIFRSRDWRIVLLAGLTILVIASASIVGHLVGAAWPDDEREASPLPSPSHLNVPSRRVEANKAIERVVLLSLGGMPADFIETYIADGTMRNLALLASAGLLTEYVWGVNPASPVVSHTSLACGSRPAATGIVGERFRQVGQPLERVANAADGIASLVPPIWQWDAGAADAVLFWPGARGSALEGAEVMVDILESPAGEELRTVPVGLAQELLQELGALPPAPGVEDLRQGRIAPADYLRLVERRVRWKAEALRYVQERYAPRLMLASFDLMEHVRPFLSLASSQEVYDSLVRQAYRAADAALGELLVGLDLTQTTIFVGSPHGYTRAGIALNMAALLEEWNRAGDPPAVVAYTSGGAAHLVVNLAGREPGGSVPQASYEKLVQAIVEKLTEYQLEDRPAFAHVLAGAGLSEWGLNAPQSGDIFVQATPGVLLAETDPTGEGRLSWPVKEWAAGYEARRPEMRGIFVIAGRRVPPAGMIAPIHLIDIAPTMAILLDVEIPASVEGRALHEILLAQ